MHMPPLAPQAVGLARAAQRCDRDRDRHRAPGRWVFPSAPTPARSSETGTPCVVFGPGDIAQAHTKDEWIDLEQVHLAAEAYFQIAVELGR